MENVTLGQQPIAKSSYGKSSSSPQLSGRLLRIVRAAWVMIAVLAGVILVLSLPAAILAINQGAYLQGHQGTIANNPDATPTTLDIAVTMLGIGVGLSAALISVILAIIIFWRKPTERMAVFVSFYLLFTGVALNGPLELMEFYIPGIAVFTTDILTAFLGATLSITLLCLFPDGRFIPHWSRWLPIASMTMLPLALFGYFRYGQFLTSPLMLLAVPVWSSTVLLAFYAQLYRYRHVSSPAERQQTKWIIYAFGLSLLLSLLSTGPYIQGRNLAPGETLPLSYVLFGVFTYLPSLLVMPVALTIAVLRFRLWDIDILISRTLVYGSLTATVITGYVLIVGLLGTLFHAGGNFIISLFATGVVALLFQPLRERLQRRVNRLMFGDRDEPYSVLERLSERLNLVVQTEQVLPTIVETVAHALKLPFVAISLRQGDTFKAVAEHFASDEKRSYDSAEIFPLVYRSEVVGQLILAPRSQGEVFSQTDRQLLDTIARQTSLAAYNVRLTDELQRSREQLVTTREEERRRLRRDLHDGLGPVLATISVSMDAIHNVADNPVATRDVAREVKTQAQSALEDIRRIAYDLRPPALDEFGLAGALKQHIEAINHVNGLRIVFDHPGSLSQLPAAIEVAAYRIALEALTNVQHHAQASKCSVRLIADAALHLEIADDGCGISKSQQTGVGLHTMQERAGELGGSCNIETHRNQGTTITVRLPLPRNAAQWGGENQ